MKFFYYTAICPSLICTLRYTGALPCHLCPLFMLLSYSLALILAYLVFIKYLVAFSINILNFFLPFFLDKTNKKQTNYSSPNTQRFMTMKTTHPALFWEAGKGCHTCSISLFLWSDFQATFLFILYHDLLEPFLYEQLKIYLRFTQICCWTIFTFLCCSDSFMSPNRRPINI